MLPVTTIILYSVILDFCNATVPVTSHMSQHDVMLPVTTTVGKEITQIVNVIQPWNFSTVLVILAISG